MVDGSGLYRALVELTVGPLEPAVFYPQASLLTWAVVAVPFFAALTALARLGSRRGQR